MKTLFTLLLAVLLLIGGCERDSTPTFSDPLPPPSNLTASVASPTSVQLKWDDSAPDNQGFKIERKEIGGRWRLINQLNGGIESYVDSMLLSNHPYFYRTYAYKGGEVSNYTNEVVATPSPWCFADTFRTLPSTTGNITALAFSPDGQTLASAISYDGGAIRLWNVADGSSSLTLQEANENIYTLAFSPDGSMLACGSSSSAKLWRITDGVLLRKFTAFGNVNSVAFSPDGKLFATGGEDWDNLGRYINIWHLSTGELDSALITERNSVSDIAFSPDGSLLACGSVNGDARLWRISDGACIFTAGATMYSYNSPVAFSPDGTLLVRGGSEEVPYFQTDGEPILRGTIELWRVSDGVFVGKYFGTSTDRVRNIEFSSDGLTFLCGGDGGVSVWSTSGRLRIATLPQNLYQGAAAYSPDGKTIATGNHEGITLWH